MGKIFAIWFVGALMLWSHSAGVDAGCGRGLRMKTPLPALGWPIAAIVVASGWKSGKKDICE